MGTIGLDGKDKNDFIPEITPMRNGMLIVYKDHYNHGRMNPMFVTNDQLATIYEKMRAAAIKKNGGVRAELLSIIEKNIDSGKKIKIFENAPWMHQPNARTVSEAKICKERMLSVYDMLDACITDTDNANVSILEETDTEIEVLIEY